MRPLTQTSAHAHFHHFKQTVAARKQSSEVDFLMTETLCSVIDQSAFFLSREEASAASPQLSWREGGIDYFILRKNKKNKKKAAGGIRSQTHHLMPPISLSKMLSVCVFPLIWSQWTVPRAQRRGDVIDVSLALLMLMCVCRALALSSLTAWAQCAGQKSIWKRMSTNSRWTACVCFDITKCSEHSAKCADSLGLKCFLFGVIRVAKFQKYPAKEKMC